jgi:hypothetical protein
MSRFPFDPLIPHIEMQYAPPKHVSGHHTSHIALAGKAAYVLGSDRRYIYRWLDYGLTHEQADQFAVRLGLHPVELWPNWFDGVEYAPLCDRPGHGAIKRHRRLGEALCLDCGEFKAAYDRRWLARNPEMARAKQARSNARFPNRNAARDARRRKAA